MSNFLVNMNNYQHFDIFSGVPRLLVENHLVESHFGQNSFRLTVIFGRLSFWTTVIKSGNHFGYLADSQFGRQSF